MSVTNAPRKLTVSTKNVLHYLIMIALMVIFYFIPSGNVVTPYGMRLLGVFIGLVYGWTFLGLLVPSIIGCFVWLLPVSLFRGGILSLIR